ncbi:hypothetical protein LC040_06320 [Bacillus tianshenii]|nr:hypothetical protein LC040_06320 [Bacillus tianshenii]
MKTLPLRLGIILLSIFQLYTIFHSWGQDMKGTIIAIVILVGCVLLLMADVFFSNDNHNNSSK